MPSYRKSYEAKDHQSIVKVAISLFTLMMTTRTLALSCWKYLLCGTDSVVLIGGKHPVKGSHHQLISIEFYICKNTKFRWSI